MYLYLLNLRLNTRDQEPTKREHVVQYNEVSKDSLIEAMLLDRQGQAYHRLQASEPQAQGSFVKPLHQIRSL